MAGSSTAGSGAAGSGTPGVDQAQSLRAQIGQHLPFLRRYARALTGSQREGDHYVRAALEAMLHDPRALDGLDPRAGLFRLFHAFWTPVENELPGEAAGADDPVGRLPRGQREALLLTAVEGFSLEETSAILDRPVDVLVDEIAAARQEIAQTAPARVLVIEDEPVIALHLQTIVEDMRHEVIGVATTASEAVAESRQHQPDLVLADIQLADGSSGIDAVHEILSDIEVPVIFITAYPERLLTGERPEPTYLITKPFEADMVSATIGQALAARA